MEKITVSKLPRAMHHGDWHDKPCLWGVFGPGDEVQHFVTRQDARLYAKARKAWKKR